MPHNKKNIFARLTAFYRLMRRAYGRYKFEIILLTILGFISGVLEGVGINALIPLLSFIVGDGTNATDTISLFLRSAFAFFHVDFAPKFLLYFIVMLFVAKAIVGVFLDYIRIRIASEYERETRERLFSAQVRSSWPHLLKQRLGHLETLILVDAPNARDLLIKFSASIVFVTSLLMYLFVVLNVSALITLLTVVLGSVFLYAMRPLSNRMRRVAGEKAYLQRETAHFVSEHLSGIKTIKASGAEEKAVEGGNHFFAELKKRGITLELLQAIAIALVPPLAILYIAGIFGLSFRYELVTIAALPTIVYLIYRIFSYVQQLQAGIQVISGAIPYLENVLAYEARAIEKAESRPGGKPFIFEKNLRFDSVDFGYGEGSDVLHDVSFTIPRGAMVGIIGPSGAGKTTCVDLMLGLLAPRKGSVLLDGVSSMDISVSDWRAKVAYVSQDLFLLHDTIRNNIRFYDDSILDDAIWEAAKMAHIDEFIKSRPEGLDTTVGERGIELSAGQRQRLVIARALARKPEILILDEATSALDAESEAHIEKMLREFRGKITVIVIAHRLSTITHSDSLIVLEGGRVIETGAPTELLKIQDSYFSRVFKIA